MIFSLYNNLFISTYLKQNFFFIYFSLYLKWHLLLLETIPLSPRMGILFKNSQLMKTILPLSIKKYIKI